jgi:hypothetical protein
LGEIKPPVKKQVFNAGNFSVEVSVLSKNIRPRALKILVAVTAYS